MAKWTSSHALVNKLRSFSKFYVAKEPQHTKSQNKKPILQRPQVGKLEVPVIEATASNC